MGSDAGISSQPTELEGLAMALRPCKACAKQVSTGASACPHCGHPVRQQFNVVGFLSLLVLVAIAVTYYKESQDSGSADSLPKVAQASVALPEKTSSEKTEQVAADATTQRQVSTPTNTVDQAPTGSTQAGDAERGRAILQMMGPANGDIAQMSDQEKSARVWKTACDEQRQNMQDQLDLEAAGSKGSYPGAMKDNLARWIEANCSSRMPDGTPIMDGQIPAH